jgi:hypothetical protein
MATESGDRAHHAVMVANLCGQRAFLRRNPGPVSLEVGNILQENQTLLIPRTIGIAYNPDTGALNRGR